MSKTNFKRNILDIYSGRVFNITLKKDDKGLSDKEILSKRGLNGRNFYLYSGEEPKG